jgi:hypothetical protein
MLDRLCLSPQCGFASEMMGNPITMEVSPSLTQMSLAIDHAAIPAVQDMEKKLKLVTDVSRRVWNY